MAFIAVIFAYVISVSLSGSAEPLTGSVMRWHEVIFQRKWDSRISVLIYALLPAIAVGVVLTLLDNGLFDFVVSVGFLLLMFRSGDQPEVLATYQQKLELGDEKSAWQLAVDELGLEKQLYEPGDEAIDEGVQAGLAYLYLERFFVSVFWFTAFGAPGVALVWLVSVANKHDEDADAFSRRILQALYWIPVRLMAFTLALMGNFTQCFQVWLEQAKDFERNDRVLLITCLKSALGEVSEDKLLSDTLSLLKRSQQAWLVGLALLLIFGF